MRAKVTLQEEWEPAKVQWQHPGFRFVIPVRELTKEEYAANRERTEAYLKEWREFEERHPELAKEMVCHVFN